MCSTNQTDRVHVHERRGETLLNFRGVQYNYLHLLLRRL